MPLLCNALRYVYASEYALRSDNALRNVSGQKFSRHAAACFESACIALGKFQAAVPPGGPVEGFARRVAMRAREIAPEDVDVSSADHIELANEFIDYTSTAVDA